MEEGLRRLCEIDRFPQLAFVEVNVAHRGVEMLVARKRLDHARVDALVSELSEKLTAPAV